MNLAGQVVSDASDGSWSGWPWRSHFQNDLFTICWELQAISLLSLSLVSLLSPPSPLLPLSIPTSSLSTWSLLEAAPLPLLWCSPLFSSDLNHKDEINH